MPLWLTWLILFATVATFVAVASWRECRNLALLAGAFATNAVAFMFLPASYAIAASADLVMALLAVVLWCWASPIVARLSLFLMAVNLIMVAWYAHPVPYDAFMAAYGYHPHIVRFTEAMQLCAMIYFTPSVQRLAGRQPKEKTGEPPCHRLTEAR